MPLPVQHLQGFWHFVQRALWHRTLKPKPKPNATGDLSIGFYRW